MKNLKELFVACVTVTGIATLAACTVESPTYVTAQDGSGDGGASTEVTTSTPTSNGGGGGGGGASSPDGGSAPSSCQSAYVAVDVSKLTACGNGAGHCYDPAKVDLGAGYAACPTAGQVCVPDEVLTADGNKLKSCTSIIGPGGCITASLIPAIQQMGGSALKQDVCNAGQLCVPCVDPTHNNAPTGMCSAIGAHQDACSGGGSAGADAGPAAPPLDKCCKSKNTSNGVCISSSAIPASQQDQAKQDTCKSGDKCVPAAFVSGMPVKCDGGLFGSGVCMDQCFNDMMGTAKSIGILSGKGCGSTEVCVPCGLVSGQGVPGCN